MNEWQSRQIALIGEDATARLAALSVLVAGVGGVGGYAVEALARAGVGRLVLVDHDTVSQSNRNRQIIALTHTVGKEKVALFKERILSVNPACRVEALPLFLTPENTEALITAHRPDWIVDAIDFVPAKRALALAAMSHSIPLIASMGTGNKRHPERLRIGDLSKTAVCPLARVMRRETRAAGIAHMCVLWSDELPEKANGDGKTPASISFLPASAGLLIASHLINAEIEGNSASCMVLPRSSC